MEITRIIVSSRNLAQLLAPKPEQHVQTTSPVRFSFGEIGGNKYAEINGTLAGPVQRAFESFELDKSRAVRLHAIASALTEQPITLVWDGARMTIADFTI